MKNKTIFNLLKKISSTIILGAFLFYSFSPILVFGIGLGVENITEKNSEEKIQDFHENKNDIEIPFIPNFGQLDEQVKFYADFFSGTFFISEKELTYLFARGGKEKRSNRNIDEEEQLEAFSLKEKFLDKKGNQINFTPKEGTKSEKKVSFFKGEESQWKSSVDVYDFISLGEVWSDIEVIAQAKKDNVEKLFNVQPGGDPGDISMLLEGADRLIIDEKGELVIETEIGKFSMTKPIAYQIVNGKKIEVQVSYDIHNENSYKFSLGEYDKSKPLTIDPLVASTYIGGADGDFKLSAYGMDFDSSGNLYLCGRTTSALYPTTAGVIYPTYSASYDGFISILSSDLTSLIASTYIGGSLSDSIESIKVNGNEIVVAGETVSSNFPTTVGAYDTTYSGGGTKYNIFIMRLNSSLTAIEASTFFGAGNIYEYFSAMEIDSNGKIIITGYASASTFPVTAGAYDTTFGGSRDIFVSRLNPSLAASPSCLEASTFIGGSSYDYSYKMELDASDNIVVVGETSSSNFPVTAGAYQSVLGDSGGSIIISKINNSLTSLIASTLLAGSNADSYDEASGMALDSSGNVFIIGTSYYGYFPTTAGAYRETFNTSEYYDIFIAKMSSDLTSLDAATYFGGLTSEDYPGDISIDSNGKIFIVGYAYPQDSEAADIPTTEGAFQTVAAANDWYTQTFVSRFSPDLTTLEASTLINGDDEEEGYLIRVNPNDDVAVFMTTESTNLPINTGAYSSTVGTGNGYIIILDNDLSAGEDAPDHLKITGAATQVAGETQQITIMASDINGDALVTYAGEKSITLSGPAVAPAGTAPTCTDKDGVNVAIGTATTMTFVDGVATCNLKLYKAESASLDVTDGIYNSLADEDYDLNIVVRPAVVNAANSIIDVSADPSVVWQEEVVTVTSKDLYENLLQDGGEDVEISISGINTSSLTVADNYNGTYTAKYTPTCDLGVDAITGTINDDAIGEDGDGTSDGTYNITTQIKITVTVNDLNGEQVSYGEDEVILSITGANNVTPSVIDNGDGTYSAYYTPTSTGTDHVSGTLNGRAIGSDLDGTDDGIYQFEVCEELVAYDYDQSSDFSRLANSEKSNTLSQKIENKVAQISSYLIPNAEAKDIPDQPKLPETVKQESSTLDELDFEKINDISIPFVENDSVVEDPTVKYFSNLNSGRFYVTEDALSYSIFENPEGVESDEKATGVFFKERFLNLNEDGESIKFSPKGKDQATVKSNLFRGNDRSNWRTNLASYKKLSLGEIWENIEVDLFSYSQKVEKVFSVAPEGNVDDITLRFEGVDSFSLNETKELLLTINGKEVKFSKPIAYQESKDGERKAISVNYSIKKDGSYGFRVGAYDKTKTLIIDPWLGGTYLGGSRVEDQVDVYEATGKKMVEDSDGNIFVAMSTSSSDFPTTVGVYDETKNAIYYGIAISKFNPELTELLASTIIEGTGANSYLRGIAIDSADKIFMLGDTISTDFPLTSGAYDSVDDNLYGSFVISKFSNDLSALEASTVVQGKVGESGHELAIDSSDNIYVVGQSSAGILETYYSITMGTWGYYENDFPTTPGAWIPEFHKEGMPDNTGVNWNQNLLIKMSNDLSQLLASTFLPQCNSNEVSFMITSSGNIVFSGTSGRCYSTTYTDPSHYLVYDNSYYFTDGTFDSAPVVSKGNILILDPNLTSLVAGSAIGGSIDYDGNVNGAANIFDFSEDSNGNIYVVGSTRSVDFPTTAGAFDETYNGNEFSDYNGYIAKVSGDLTQLLKATYYGGFADNHIFSIDLDSNSNVFVTGYGSVPNPPVGSFEGGTGSIYKDFVARFSSDLASLDASGTIATLEGKGSTVLVSSTDEVYITGTLDDDTFSTKVLASNAVGFYDSTPNGGDDVFVVKFDNYLSNDSDPQESLIDVSTCVPGESPPAVPTVIADHYAIEAFAIVSDMEGFEDDLFPPTNFTTGGDLNWTRDTTTTYAGSLGSLGSDPALIDNQFGWVETTYDFSIDGSLSFNWKVSSESGYDFLVFCLDNSSCTRSTGYNQRISGAVDWTEVSIPVTAGTHSFRWLYGKDSSATSGSDRGWIDNVSFNYSAGLEQVNAGESNEIEISSYESAEGSALFSFTGNLPVIFSGAHSGGGDSPTCTDKNGTAIPFGTDTVLAFTNGVATCDLVLYASENISIDVTDGVVNSFADPSYDLDLTVTGGAVPETPTLSPTNSSINLTSTIFGIGEEVVITLESYDTEGNRYTTGGQTVVISVSGVNPNTPTVADNGDGIYTATYTALNLGADQITATLGAVAVGADNDGLSDGTFNLTVTEEGGGSPVPVDDEVEDEEEEEEKDHITLTSSKDGKLTFDVLISKEKKVKSDSIKDTKDESTEIRNVAIKTKSKKIEGDLIIRNKDEKPENVVFPQEVDECLPFQILDIDTDFSNKDVKEAELNFRIPHGWLKKYDQENLVFVIGKSLANEKMLEKNKWAKILTSTLVNSDDKYDIYKVAADYLDGYWGVYGCADTKEEETEKKGQEQKKKDIDNDGTEETATDQNGDPSDGYEDFSDSDGSSEETNAIDGDQDGKTDFLINTNESENPEIYWDPDDEVATAVYPLDLDSDQQAELIIDSDGDGDFDRYYDPSEYLVKEIVRDIPGLQDAHIIYIENDGEVAGEFISLNDTARVIEEIDGDNDGEQEYFIDTDGDNIPDIYWDPLENIFSDVQTENVDDDATDEWVFGITNDNIPDRYWDPDDRLIKLLEKKKSLALLAKLENFLVANRIAGILLPLAYLLMQLGGPRNIATLFRSRRLLAIPFWKKKRKNEDWGVVYDSNTGKPLPFAVVKIINAESGKLAEIKVTDKYGTFFFLVSPGSYLMEVTKKGYQLQENLQEITSKVFYENTYDGKVFEAEGYDKFSKNIAMEQTGADFIQELFSRRFALVILNVIFILGFISSLIIAFFYPNTFNILTVLVYFYLAFIQNAMLTKAKWGLTISEKKTPQPFTVLTLMNQDEKTVMRTISDENGRYFIVADKGEYLLKVITAGQAQEKLFPIKLKQLGSIKEVLVV